jgi:RNA polymerase sigma-70 factor, ECF subfamily
VARHLSSAQQPSPGDAGGAAAGRSELDEAGFDQLFRECAADVHGYAISLLGDRAGAEDVTALAFERVYRARARLDRSRGTPRAWLFAIARNAALDELRRRRRARVDASEVDAAAAAPFADAEPDAALEHAERRVTVQAALLELTPREREVVLLKFHGQLTNGELAQVLGISESNAGTRVHRALTTLRDTCADLSREKVA